MQSGGLTDQTTQPSPQPHWKHFPVMQNFYVHMNIIQTICHHTQQLGCLQIFLDLKFEEKIIATFPHNSVKPSLFDLFESFGCCPGHASFHIQAVLDTRARCVKINKLVLGARWAGLSISVHYLKWLFIQCCVDVWSNPHQSQWHGAALFSPPVFKP